VQSHTQEVMRCIIVSSSCVGEPSQGWQVVSFGGGLILYSILCVVSNRALSSQGDSVNGTSRSFAAKIEKCCVLYHELMIAEVRSCTLTQESECLEAEWRGREV
jgi:hypothetical protein